MERDAASEILSKQVGPPNEEQEPPLLSTEQMTEVSSRKKEEVQRIATGNCTFSGVAPIALQRFEESGVSRVECPDCGRAWTLSPHGGVLRFKSHDKRKTNTPNTGQRWAREKTDWSMVGGEEKVGVEQ